MADILYIVYREYDASRVEYLTTHDYALARRIAARMGACVYVTTTADQSTWS